MEGRGFGNIERKEGKVDAFLEVIICGGNERLKFFGARDKGSRMVFRRRGGWKSMVINEVTNAGYKRVKGSGMVLDSWSVVVCVEKGLEESLS